MRERRRSDISDGICWYCTQCKSTKTVRESSFFSKSRISLRQWMMIIYWWARQYPVSDCNEEAEVDQHTAIDIYQWLREVCTTRLMQDPPIVLGGPGLTVQIDESLFRHKPKVNGVALVSCVLTVMLSLLSHLCSIIEEDPPEGKYGFL